MKRDARILVTVTFLFLSGAATLGVRHLALAKRDATPCARAEVHFSREAMLLDSTRVLAAVRKDAGELIGRRTDSIPLARIEQAVMQLKEVRRSEAWMTVDGVLHISVTERMPVLRIDRLGTESYLDGEGYEFPRRSETWVHTPLVKGYVPAVPDKEWVKGILSLNSTVSRSGLWKEPGDIFEIDVKGDLRYTPADTVETFIFGDCSALERKMAQIRRYYESIVPARKAEDAAAYRAVNVKYDRQIICR